MHHPACLIRRIFVGAFLAGVFVVISSGGCQNPSQPAASPSSPHSSNGNAPNVAEPDQLEQTPPLSNLPSPTVEVSKPTPRKKPKRPIDSWIIFRTAADADADVICNYQWTGGKRLQVVTQNVTRLTLDLNRLPDGAPRRGPWNLQIDHQGIEITGVRGRVLDLIRSTNGIWSVDPDKPPRRD